jgi:hypothetical protein
VGPVSRVARAEGVRIRYVEHNIRDDGNDDLEVQIHAIHNDADIPRLHLDRLANSGATQEGRNSGRLVVYPTDTSPAEVPSRSAAAQLPVE